MVVMSEYIVVWRDNDGNIFETAELSLREAKQFSDYVLANGYEIVMADHFKNWRQLESYTI